MQPFSGSARLFQPTLGLNISYVKFNIGVRLVREAVARLFKRKDGNSTLKRDENAKGDYTRVFRVFF